MTVTHDQPHLRDLSLDECRHLLAEQRIGRVGFVDDGQPVVLPVTYLMDGAHVLFTTHQGGTLASAAPGTRVAFEVDGVDADRQAGWSVLVKGVAQTVTDPAELDRVRGLPLSSWAGPGRTTYLRVVASSVTGRRVEAGEDLASLWWG